MGKKAIFQVSLLAGTIIGAGVFALPFVFQASGLYAGFFYLAVGALALIVIHLMYADLVIRTDEEHRFLGYAQIYLGNFSFWPILLMTVVGAVFVLAIYLILSKSFSHLVGFPGGDMEAALFFWFMGSLSIFVGLRKIAWLEFLATAGMIAIIGMVFLWGLGSLEKVEFGMMSWDWRLLIFPLGPVLFALSGRVAIPSLVKYSKEIKSVRNSIILGTALPAVVYGLFVLSILGLSGMASPDAISGLLGNTPGWFIILIGVFGLLSLWTSYIAVGFDIYKSLLQDLSFSRLIAPLIIAVGPLLIYFFSPDDFIKLVGISGGIFIALESLLIVWMWLRADKISPKPRVFMKILPSPIVALTVLVFIAALGYEVIKLSIS